MARGIDHIVHAVHDLDAAGEFYRRLGFTVGARNAHPWGTHNRIVQFAGSFIELLTVAEPEKIRPSTARHFSFGAFTRDFLAHDQGLSMLVLESRDAEADARAFRAAGIGDFKPFHFEREGKRPDGTTVKVAFSLAFARPPASEQAGFFVCQQHFPENFWNPEFQRHANTASAIAGVVMVVDDPPDAAAFLQDFTGVAPAASTAKEAHFTTARGEIAVISPAAFENRYGVALPTPADGLRIAGLRFLVMSIDTLCSHLEASGVPFQRQADRVAILPADAYGAALVFEPRPAG